MVKGSSIDWRWQHNTISPRMVTILNESKVNERRSKTFSNLKRQKSVSPPPERGHRDTSKFFTFSQFNEMSQAAKYADGDTPEQLGAVGDIHFKSISDTPKTESSLSLREFKEKVRNIEAVLEMSEESARKLAEPYQGCAFNEKDVEEVVMSLSMKKEPTLYSALTANKDVLLNSKLKEQLSEATSTVGVLIERMELFLYENFWFTLLYINFWFPSFVSFLRYVPW